jgi:predicted transcriptional regulator
VTASPLNIAQERELNRLLQYERKTCSANGELVYHCAFPYRPDNDLQAELIELGYLAAKNDRDHGTVVRITSEGYSYFPALMREEDEKTDRSRRDARLIAITAVFCALCMVIGFMCGYLLR